MKCLNCGIEFEGRKDAKYCSPKCKLQAFRKQSVETDNVTLSETTETDNFQFTVRYNRKLGDEGYDSDIGKQRATPRTAKYWYDIPLGAIPIKQKGWPDMPEFMNGRQYFLWWKNEFVINEDKTKGEVGMPIIHNPFPERTNVLYQNAGEGSRRWGA